MLWLELDAGVLDDGVCDALGVDVELESVDGLVKQSKREGQGRDSS